MAPGFTLVEMLVVISIITVMLTVGSLGLRNLSKARGVSAGLPIAEAVFAEARSVALGKGTKTRVLISAEQDNHDRYLRYMAIAYMELNNDGQETGNWIIASRGSKLPEGVYFTKKLSENNALPVDDMTIKLPGSSPSPCYYYEFNSEGLITNPEINGNSVPRFVIMAGSLPPGASEPRATGDNKQNIGGFVIWRSGNTSVFRHPKQIQ